MCLWLFCRVQKPFQMSMYYVIAIEFAKKCVLKNVKFSKINPVVVHNTYKNRIMTRKMVCCPENRLTT